MSHPQRLFSSRQLAEALSVSQQTIYRWRRNGKLPAGHLIGPGTRRWPLSELIKLFPALEEKQPTDEVLAIKQEANNDD